MSNPNPASQHVTVPAENQYEQLRPNIASSQAYTDLQKHTNHNELPSRQPSYAGVSNGYLQPVRTSSVNNSNSAANTSPMHSADTNQTERPEPAQYLELVCDENEKL